MIRFLHLLLRRGRRRAPAHLLAWGGGSSGAGGAPLPPPDPLLCLPGHELVEVGTVTLDFGGEMVEAAVCETHRLGAGPGR